MGAATMPVVSTASTETSGLRPTQFGYGIPTQPITVLLRTLSPSFFLVLQSGNEKKCEMVSQTGVNTMYIGGGTVVLVLIIVLIVFLVRR